MLPQFGPPARLAGGGSKCSARCNAKSAASAASAALQRWCRSRSRRRWAADRGGGWLGPGNGPNLTKCLKMIKMSILESYHTKLSYILALNCLSRKLALANAGVSSYFSITLARDEADQMPNPWFCTWSSPLPSSGRSRNRYVVHVVVHIQAHLTHSTHSLSHLAWPCSHFPLLSFRSQSLGNQEDSSDVFFPLGEISGLV